MPSVTFSDYASTSWGTMWSDVEIDYTETYNVSTNTTRVSISGVYFRVRGDTNFSTQVIRGRVKINGETVCSFSPGSSTATQINVTGSYSKLENGSGNFYADIAHAADGTASFTIAVDEAEDASISDVFGFWYAPLSHKIGVWGNDVGPQTITLTTHPRISSISVSNGYFGQPISISISRYNSSFTHTVVISCAGDTRNIMIKGSSVSFTWTPPLNDYGPRITNAMSAVATIYCHTYNGDTHVGTSTTTCVLSFRDADVAPSVSISTADPTGNLSRYGKYVKSKSKITVTATPTLRYGATLKSVSISANGATYNSSPATTDVIASASNTSVTARITDSRGQTATASVTIAIYDYTSPQINSFSVHRCNSDGTLNNSGAYMRVDYKVTVTALGNNHPNSKTLTLKYKKASASSYTSQAITLSSYTQTGEVHNIAADVNSSYNVQLVLSDDFASATSELALPTASTRVNWKPGENGGIAFGKVSEYDKTFEIADDWYLRYNNYIPLNYVVNKIPSNANLNDYYLPGVYAIGGNNTAATIANIPQQHAGTLRVFASTGDEVKASSTWKYLIQEYITYTGEKYQRESVSGTSVRWGAWKTIYNSSDFQSGASYCKMPDGTLICWGSFNTGTHTANAAWGALFETPQISVDVSFPMHFSVVPYVWYRCRPTSSQCFLEDATIVSTTGIGGNIFLFRSTSTTVSALVQWLAVGRWK